MDIVLASASPRRRELLTRMGLTFRVVVSHADEAVDKTLPSQEQVRRVSRRKADAVAALEGPEPVIIAADTVVSIDGLVLGKPASPREAEEMLARLSGREHRVFTGVTVAQGERRTTFHQETAVVFRALTAGEIAGYVRTGEPMDKAGAYGIQGRGSLLVERIQGDYFNVMGLPVCQLGLVLGEFGVPLLEEGGRP